VQRFNAGAAYVYVRNGTTWTFQQKLTATQPLSNSSFGISVDVLDDTVVVGGDFDTVAVCGFNLDAPITSIPAIK
jgi:hypothetical protein